ncbi:hypothetical protein LINPERHAP1_LOCUS20495 [Linum perenne]
MVVVLPIDGECMEDSRHGSIVHQIQQLRNRDWLQVVVQHCYREANRVDDLFDHLGHSKTLGTHLIVSPPPNIWSALTS